MLKWNDFADAECSLVQSTRMKSSRRSSLRARLRAANRQVTSSRSRTRAMQVEQAVVDESAQLMSSIR